MNPSALQRRGFRGFGEVAQAAPQQAQAAPPQAPQEEAWITLDRVMATGEVARDIGKDVDKDGDYLLTHLWGSQTGNYTLLLRLYTGRPLSSAPILNGNMVGTVQFKTPIKPIYYPAGSRISIDLENVSGASNTIQLVFGGIRLLNGGR